jgi:GNAT superfamily N-acetyltransferase
MTAIDGVEVRAATAGDVEAVAALAAARRAAYAEVQPRFWRVADDALERHSEHLAALVADPAALTLVAVDDRRLLGYLVATLVPAPPVYAPGGPSGYVDDFAVTDDRLWPTVGRALVDEARRLLLDRGAAQLVVVSGHHDEAKLAALRAAGLVTATERLVAPLDRP